jgi:hypothetical protein
MEGEHGRARHESMHPKHSQSSPGVLILAHQTLHAPLASVPEVLPLPCPSTLSWSHMSFLFAQTVMGKFLFMRKTKSVNLKYRKLEHLKRSQGLFQVLCLVCSLSSEDSGGCLYGSLDLQKGARLPREYTSSGHILRELSVSSENA